MNEAVERPIKRRDFLGIAAVSTFFASFGAALLGMIRLVKPNVFPEPSMRYKIGEPGAFPVGEVRIPEGRSVFVFHDENGFYAISAICTHLGCIVSYAAGEFECPCHGSRFAPGGEVVSGAASKALDWYAVSLAHDGQLVVDEGKTIKSQTFFKV